MALELLLFRTGGVEIVRSAFQPWLAEPGRSEMAYQPVWSALVRTSEGSVLFDTGLHPVHVDRPEATFGPRPTMRVAMEPDDAVVARLASIAVAPDDIAIVVNSHLHFDHAGNNGAFPRATFLVQRDHLAYAREHAESFPGVYWDRPELTYVAVGERSRVARGVEIVATPGHARGHQSLVLDLAETGRVILCGDAAFTRENLERGEIPAADAAAAAESLALIRSLATGDLDRCFVSHDESAWRTWRHAPASYR